jgi:hypothetical protein
MTTRMYPSSWYLRCLRCWWTNTRPLAPPIGCPPRSGGPARTWPPIGCSPRSGSPARIWPRCRSRRPTGLRELKFQTEQWSSRLVAVSSLKQRLVLQVEILLYVAPKWQLDLLYAVRTFRTVSATVTLFTNIDLQCQRYGQLRFQQHVSSWCRVNAQQRTDLLYTPHNEF